MSTVKNRALFETVPVPKAVSVMAIPTIIGRTNNPFMVGAASLILSFIVHLRFQKSHRFREASV